MSRNLLLLCLLLIMSTVSAQEKPKLERMLPFVQKTTEVKYVEGRTTYIVRYDYFERVYGPQTQSKATVIIFKLVRSKKVKIGGPWHGTYTPNAKAEASWVEKAKLEGK